MDFVSLPGSHTGENIAKCFIQIVTEFNLLTLGLCHTLTTDNATNNDVFITILLRKGYLESPEHHIRCFGHVINLAAQDSFKEMDNVFNVLRGNLVKVLHYLCDYLPFKRLGILH